MPESDSKQIGILTVPDMGEYDNERVTHDLARILQETFEVDLVGTEHLTDQLKRQVNVYAYYTRSRPNPVIRKFLLVPLTLLTMVRYVIDRSPDLVASFGNLSINGLVCSLVSSVTQTSSVVRVTSDLYNIYRHQATWLDTVSFFVQNNVLGHLAVRLADHVITLGPRMESKLIERGISPEKIHVAPQPPQVETSDREPRIDIREEYGIPANSDIVLFVGYFRQSKGPKRLVRTTEYVLEREDDVHFVVVGTGGHYESHVRDALSEYDVVHMAEWIDHENLCDYYQQSDVLLYTSNTDGLPNVVLESLYYGVPVVATDSGGEVIEYVTNIGDDYEELGQLLVDRDERVVLDELPEMATPEGNERRYRTVFGRIADDH